MRSAMTVSDLLREGTRTLRESVSESPGLDAEILLREALGATREQLFDALPSPVRPAAAISYRKLLKQRVDGIPIAYITGRREFYGHEFIVNSHVLVPRPETEFLVEFALEWLKQKEEPCRVVDVGTGSGAIAISVALETASQHIMLASDVSPEALDVAARNAEALGAIVQFVEGSLIDWLEEPVDLILANLPYLRPDQAHDGIEHEPAVALYAGDDGFSLNRSLLEDAPNKLRAGGAVIMELDPEQRDLALSAAQANLPDAGIEILADLAGNDRYLRIQTN
ncbi:MAG: peptide chain release factor N(5)-glutamine methyltransferase [Sphaerobacteraceae bacterium]|nr:MAG: peptide chain release factor N(5)-glutamine methyltransferase [Sphaerobacteraceae bacterium]